MLLEPNTPVASAPTWATKARPSHRITAVRLAMESDGRFTIRGVTQLEPNMILAVSGPGFNEMTIRVRVSGENYLVFRQDIRSIEPSE